MRSRLARATGAAPPAPPPPRSRPLRHGAELGEIAVDEAGVELAGAEVRRGTSAARNAILCAARRRPCGRARPRAGRAPRRASAHARSPWRSSDRRTASPRRRPRRRCRRGCPRPPGNSSAAELAGRRQKAALGILGIEPRFDGVTRRAAPASCVSGSVSPAATRNCHSTRSRPVIASVTGCSTCSRVFISMNQKPSALQPVRAVGDELDRAGAHIADRLRGRDRGAAHARAQGRASCRAPALPRSPSGGGAAASSRAR